MCGIAGYFGSMPFGENQAIRALATMRQRGPDGLHFRFFDQGSMRVALLHSRLSIIDLNSRADQPFTVGRYTIVFNGEIYNYLELKKRLEGEGVSFSTESDTEVLLWAFIRWGELCLDRLEGMWAFAIYDSYDHKLLLSKDRFSEKPLYYVTTPHGFYFASQTSTLHEMAGQRFPVNQTQVLRYLINGPRSLHKESSTYYSGVHTLTYGQVMRIGDDLKPRVHNFFVPEYRPDNTISREDAVHGIRALLIESMRLRLRSDVPLAFCLSGGVDSATIASIAAKEFNHRVETFSIIEEDERYNEHENIMATVKDLDCMHNLIRLSKRGSLNEISQLVWYHDAPIAAPSRFVHLLLMKEISKKGFKVAFSGVGADELFTGYYDHFNLHLFEMRNHLRFAEFLGDWNLYIRDFVRNPYLKDPYLYFPDPAIRAHVFLNNEKWRKYLNKGSLFTEGFKERLFTSSPLRNRMLNELFHESTSVILHGDDLNSMFYSVENRSPFLDSKVFDYAYRVPSEHLIADGYGKYLLRDAMRGILNDQVRLDRRKKGFNASVDSLIDFHDSETLEYLLEPSAEIFKLVDRKKISLLLKDHPSDNSYSMFLFRFVNARIFLN